MQSPFFYHRLFSLAAFVSRAPQIFAKSFRTPPEHHCSHISCAVPSFWHRPTALVPHPLLAFKLENSISINEMGKLCGGGVGAWWVVGHTSSRHFERNFATSQRCHQLSILLNTLDFFLIQFQSVSPRQARMHTLSCLHSRSWRDWNARCEQ